MSSKLDLVINCIVFGVMIVVAIVAVISVIIVQNQK